MATQIDRRDPIHCQGLLSSHPDRHATQSIVFVESEEEKEEKEKEADRKALYSTALPIKSKEMQQRDEIRSRVVASKTVGWKHWTVLATQPNSDGSVTAVRTHTTPHHTHRTALHRTALHHTTPTAPPHTAQHYTTLHHTAPHRTAPHHTAPPDTPLHRTAPHYLTPLTQRCTVRSCVAAVFSESGGTTEYSRVMDCPASGYAKGGREGNFFFLSFFFSDYDVKLT